MSLQIIRLSTGTLYLYSSGKWGYKWNDKTTIAEIEELLA